MDIIYLSKLDKNLSPAASNAISILNLCTDNINQDYDLSECQIEGADLSNSIFNNVDFKNANLQDVNFANSIFINVNFENAKYLDTVIKSSDT